MRRIFAVGFTFILISGCTPTPVGEQSVPVSSTAASASTASSIVPSSSSASSKKAAVKDGCYPGSCSIAAMTDAELKKILSTDEYQVMRKGGTETPYTSPLLKEKRPGTYVAADTGEPLFRSETKFESNTGWPSFYAPINAEVLVEKTDTTLGITRTEILTRNGSHLGHVFEDGPEPTGLRYCINGLALRFIPDPA